MDYSPKLKAAMEEIKVVLNKHDIAGAIVLHDKPKDKGGDGHSEFYLKLNPSYSCITPEPYGFRIRGKLDRDFNGDKKKQKEVVINTVNMLSLMSDTSAYVSMAIINMSEKLDKETGAEHGEGKFTGHDEINN